MPNKTSTYVWAYQAAVGTSIITAVNSVSYEFGEYNPACGKWDTPFVENKSSPNWVAGSRTPTLTDLESAFPLFSHVFCPVSLQFLAWFLGKPVDSDPEVEVSALTTKMTYPLTIRLEELGGSAPQNAQAVDCYCIGLVGTAERGSAFIVQCDFAWGAFEDIGDNPNLTTAPLAAALMTGMYNGNPIVTWDIGGDNVPIPDVFRADFRLAKDYEIVSGDQGAIQTVYTYEIQPVEIILSAVFKLNDVWDDYIDRKVSTNMTIQLKKFDDTSYITLTFTNCRVQSIKKTGDRNKGHYGSVCTLRADKVEAISDWFTEGGITFDDHWKADL